MMHQTRLCLAFIFALLFAPLRAELQFTGILVTSKQTLFAVTETSSGESGWRHLGQTFAGAEITGYDAKADTLTLRRDGATFQLRLKDAKVRSGRIEIAGTVRFGLGEKVTVIRGTLIFDQENVFPLGDGLVCRLTPSLRADGTILYRAVFDEAGPDGNPEKLSAPAVIVQPDVPFEVRVGEFGFSFVPKTSSTP